MNPIQMLQLKKMWEQFTKNHPKFPLFLNAVYKDAVQEGSLMEIQVKTPEGKEYSTNLKLTESDLELIHQLRKMK